MIGDSSRLPHGSPLAYAHILVPLRSPTMSTLSLSTLERAVVPLDAARSRVMRVAVGTRIGVFLVGRRDRRVAAQAACGVLFTFLLVMFAPAMMLAVGPIVFGVPHVASDVRYLVLRRGVSRPAIALTLTFAALVTAVRGLGLLVPDALPWAGVEMALLCAWVGSAALAGASSSKRSELIIPVVLLTLGAALFVVPRAIGTGLVLAHAHNVIAIAVWLFVFRRNVRAATVPLLLAGLAVIVLLSGVTLPVSMAHGHALGLSLAESASWMAPGFSARAGVAIVLSFAFLQSMHYAVWLGWIPQEDVRAEGTLSFKMSLRSMTRDFGSRGLGVVAALTVLVVLGACFALTRTLGLYLSFAVFHGYLEIAMLAYFLCAARTSEEPVLGPGVTSPGA
jgi:hypothetical protein